MYGALDLVRKDRQGVAMDNMTEKFNALIEELKSMFIVSQAMARDSFDATISYPIEGQTDNPDAPPAEANPDNQ